MLYRGGLIEGRTKWSPNNKQRWIEMGKIRERESRELMCVLNYILLIDAPPWRVFISIPAYERSEYRFVSLERKEYVVCNGATAEWKITIS